jgi:hypothetical protein
LLNVPDRKQDSDHVAAVARRALHQAAAGRAIPPEHVRAIAAGEGNRSALLATSRSLYGEANPLDLVLFDTDRIASYVFESSRPPVLAGGSRILYGLNRDIGSDHEHEVIFSGGGEGLLLVPAGRGAQICDQIRQRYADRTAGALDVTAEFLPVSPADFAATEGERELAPCEGVRLRDIVRGRKNSRLPERHAVPGGGPRCVSCRDRAAGNRRSPRQDLDLQPEGFLCDPCARRWDEGRYEVIAGNSFEDLVENFNRTLGTDSSGARRRAQYLGFLYADGNAMGNLFGRLTSLTDLRFASRAVAEIFARTNDRVEAAVALRLPPRQALLSLLGGGDETIWILPSALAVQMAGELEAWIEKEANQISGLSALLAAAGSPRLTFGAGLVLCDLSFPVRYQYELASTLLKNAKAMFLGTPPDAVESSIDFAVLTDSSPLSEDLKTARRLAYRTDERDFLRTCRPYAYGDFSALLDLARAASQAGIGKSQLYALQAGAAEGRKVFLNHLRYQLAREPATKSYLKWIGVEIFADPEAIERFFLRKVPAAGRGVEATWIPDLLELAPFLDLLASGQPD